MPVDTGMVPDDAIVVQPDEAPAVTEDTPAPPPDVVGGLVVIDRDLDPETGEEFLTVAEDVPLYGDDGQPVLDEEGEQSVEHREYPAVEFRGRLWRLRSAMPSKVLLNLASLTSELRRPGVGGKSDNERATKALSRLNSAIEKVVDPVDQVDFDEFLMDSEPVIEFPELNELLGSMVKRLTGRPTQSASQ